MTPCDCTSGSHVRRRIVLTGGPGAGKTAVLELLRRNFCEHVLVVPESASIVFGGGFPRRASDAARRAAQRAIYRVQHELEGLFEVEHDSAAMVCDRGTVDGVAYWPGEAAALWRDVGTTIEAELARYDLVVHLRVPGPEGYPRANGVRIETPEEALRIDARIAEAWSAHPRRVFVDSHPSFLEKARHALEIVRAALPPCCRRA